MLGQPSTSPADLFKKTSDTLPGARSMTFLDEAKYCGGFLCVPQEDGTRIHQYMPANIARDFERRGELAILEYQRCVTAPLLRTTCVLYHTTCMQRRAAHDSVRFAVPSSHPLRPPPTPTPSGCRSSPQHVSNHPNRRSGMVHTPLSTGT